VEGHYMQIWCTTYHHNRQWPIIYRQGVSQILHRLRHQTHHKLCRTSTNQWASGSSEQSYSHRATQEVGYRQRPMAWRVNRSTMGLQMHPSIINKRIPIQPSLRRIRHDTGRNWRTIPAPRTIRPNSQPPKHGLTSWPPSQTQRKSPNTQSSRQTTSCQEI